MAIGGVVCFIFFFFTNNVKGGGGNAAKAAMKKGLPVSFPTGFSSSSHLQGTLPIMHKGDASHGCGSGVLLADVLPIEPRAFLG